jgi:MFS family permease
MAAYPGLAAPAGLRGRYIASMQTMFNLGGALGPVLGVAIYRAVGSAVWGWCAAGCVVGLALALAGMRSPAPAVEKGFAQ